MYQILLMINALALLMWGVYATKLALYTLRVFRLCKSVKNKRRFLTFVTIPGYIMTLIYYWLLLLWIIMDYDKIVDTTTTLAWSIFHLLTPIFLFSKMIFFYNILLDFYIKNRRIQKNIETQ